MDLDCLLNGSLPPRSLPTILPTATGSRADNETFSDPGSEFAAKSVPLFGTGEFGVGEDDADIKERSWGGGGEGVGEGAGSGVDSSAGALASATTLGTALGSTTLYF